MKLNKLVDQVKQLHEELCSATERSTLFNPRVVTLREKLKKNYLKLLALDKRAAHVRDLSRNLWRLVFYASIGKLRKQLKQFENASSAGKTSGRDREQHLKVLSTFLHECDLFYREVIKVSQETHGSIGISLPGEDSSKKSKNLPKFLNRNAAKSCFICYESLIYLGDILRYTQTDLKPTSQLSFRHSTICYRQAAYLCPQSGNPHNQMSMIFLYTKDNLRAVYHNYRALFSEAPFPNARGTFKLLFEKIVSKSAEPEGKAGSQAACCVACLLQISAALFSKIRSGAFEEKYDRFLQQFKQFCSFPLEKQRAHLTMNPKRETQDNQIIYFIIRVVVLTICNVHTALDQGQKKNKEQITRADKVLRKYLLLAISVQLDLVRCCQKVKTISAVGLPAIKVYTSWLRDNEHVVSLMEEDIELKDGYNKFKAGLTSLLKGVHSQTKVAKDSCGLLEDVELRGFTPLSQSQEGIKYEVWQYAQRPIEGNYRKSIRITRLMCDIQILSGDPDLFKQEILDSQVSANCAEKFLVWKGKDFTPFPERIFPDIQEDRRNEMILDQLKSDDEKGISNAILAALNQEKSIDQEYIEKYWSIAQDALVTYPMLEEEPPRKRPMYSLPDISY